MIEDVVTIETATKWGSGGEFILSKTHCFLRDLVDFLKVIFPSATPKFSLMKVAHRVAGKRDEPAQ